MIEHIPQIFAQRTAFHWEQESNRSTRKRTSGLECHCARYGGGESKSTNDNDSETTTTTTSNVQDQRKGVSEEGILAEANSTVNVDRSETNTTIVEDVSEEIAIAAIENSSGVAEIAIEQSTQLGESALDTSETLFREASGNLELFSKQNAELATKFLDEGKNLIKDQNRESGERLGNTAIIGAFALGAGFLALQFFKK